MAGSVNKVTLVGNLGRDPEVRNTQSGSKIVNLTLATSDSWNDRATGERRERTEWHRIVIFNERLADVAERFLRKGRKIYVEGELRTRKWTDQSGAEKYTTEVVLDRFRGDLVLLDGRNSGDEGGFSGGSSNSGGGSSFGNPRPQNAPQNPQRSTAGSPSSSQPQGGQSWDTGAHDNDLDDEIPF
ncbi:single-stranded DNA-binding protein [Oecophyllibacter saccharovorans]|uniref:Single-stranded DNA-binding protein n=1 Tax=Oecophyllibacter saccharovorans TaxID=2558360 RepID=A0A506UKR3_9PROT|nr:single-stranded DNA-binding protein [Oecophyllibacter saccharovorans]TPW33910.1 single-stranded DNA-binding protein [Oecophyllibacter saccharovorans]